MNPASKPALKPADAMLEILRDEGITRIFGNPGTTELPFLEALRGAPDLEYVLGLQEGSVVAMADGYARATRRPSFVNLHVAPGVSNGLVGLMNASRSRTPMVVTAGQQDQRHLLQEPMLSGDLVGLASPMVKAAWQVHHAYDLPLLLRRAFALAVQPPTGPVFVSIPMDVLEEEGEVTVPGRTPTPSSGPAPDLWRAADLLTAAERPVIVAGDGVGRAGVMADLVAVAERLGATVYHEPMYDTLSFPLTHPLYAGMMPRSNAATRETLAPHDVLLLVGCPAFMPLPYTPGLAVPDGLTIVQFEADPAEIGRNFPVDLGLSGDVGTTLRGLGDALAGRVPDAEARLKAAVASSHDHRTALDARALGAYGSAPIDPFAAAHAVATGLPADAVVVDEAITVGVRLRTVARWEQPGSYVHTVGGGLGWGIGAAIGTRMGDPGRPVVAVLGDGCAMFGIQGLWSAARYGIPVLFLVMNNGEYRTLKETVDGRKRAAGPPYIGLDLAPPALEWSAAARFFGIDSVRVESAEALREVVAGVSGLEGPMLVDVPIRNHALAEEGIAR